MEGYKHGIKSRENTTSYPMPTTTENAVQVIWGTSPINLAENPKQAVNRPVMVRDLRRPKRLWGIVTIGKSIHCARACMPIRRFLPYHQ